jgi:hypothetical protein
MSDNGIVFRDDGTILVKDVRLSYAHVFRKWGAEGDPEEKKGYSGKFLIPKERMDAVIKPLAAKINTLSQEAFKTKLASDRVFLRNGDDSGKEACSSSPRATRRTAPRSSTRSVPRSPRKTTRSTPAAG